MIKITFLGTGSAMTRNKSNTCFIVEQKDNILLVDSGGGHEILKLIEDNKFEFEKINTILITHSHIDHIYGMPFIFRRMIELNKKIKILCSKDTKKIIETLIKLDIPKYFKIYKSLLNYTFLNRTSYYHNFKLFKVDKNQHGFILNGDKKKIAFTGDIPANGETTSTIKNCDILIHESFCSEKQRVKEKIKIRGNHSTIENAIKVSIEIGAEKLLATHHFTDLSTFNSDKIRIVKDGDVIII
ncbi:MAG: MBL fold metallo-hydrolase [Candidatus Woesearchaeota archaeon]